MHYAVSEGPFWSTFFEGTKIACGTVLYSCILVIKYYLFSHKLTFFSSALYWCLHFWVTIFLFIMSCSRMSLSSLVYTIKLIYCTFSGCLLNNFLCNFLRFFFYLTDFPSFLHCAPRPQVVVSCRQLICLVSLNICRVLYALYSGNFWKEEQKETSSPAIIPWSYLLSVWGQLIIFFHFHFHAWFGMLPKGMGESFLLSEDEPLTPNIDGVMALWIFRRRAQTAENRRKSVKNWTSKF